MSSIRLLNAVAQSRPADSALGCVGIEAGVCVCHQYVAVV